MSHTYTPSLSSVLLLVLLVASTATSSSSSSSSSTTYDTRFSGVTWDNDNWILTTTALDQGHYQSRMSLANGYLGINLAAVGPFFEVDSPVDGDVISGWPIFNRRQTFATISGFWDEQPSTNGTNFSWLDQYGGESVISGIPHWAGLTVTTPSGLTLNATVDPTQIANFASSMDFKAGVLSWDYTWGPGSDPLLAVSYTMLVSKISVNQAAVQLSLTPLADVNVTITDVLDGDCAVRANFVAKGGAAENATIWTAVSPVGIDNVTAYVYSTLTGDGFTATTTQALLNDSSSSSNTNESTIAQSALVQLTAGTTSTFTKFIGAASSDAFAGDAQRVARDASAAGAAAGFEALRASHSAEWASILTPDSVDSYALANGSLPNGGGEDVYILEQQITSVTNPFQMLQNTVGVNALAAAGNNSALNVNSIMVGGLGSDSYAGFIFWDADIWMSSALVTAFPHAASAISQYRARLFSQAQKNVAMAYTSSQNATGKFSAGGAVFPWTSGRSGACSGCGPCFDYEYHINGDIGLTLYNYLAVTGDYATFEAEYFPVYDAIATFYAELVTLDPSTGEYILTNATDPDEYANFVDNPGYTMALIKTHLETANTLRQLFGLSANALAANRSSSISVPEDDTVDIYLEYEGMNGSISVKQADIVLIDDFLDYPNPYSLSNLDYYAGKQSVNGPGMTYGVFSIVANAFSPSGCASYTYGVYSSHPYVRAPWFQYSEQLLDDYRLNGGTHPAYPFLTGMGGANRVALFGYLGLRLRLDALNIDPSLPPQIARLDYRTFYWQGYAINAVSNATHTTVSRITTSVLDNANPAYANASIPITIGSNAFAPAYYLPASGDEITIPNRDIASVKTWAGNMAQCVPATSEYDFEPGQFPFAANDGAVSTKWQPVSANVTSSITLDLGEAVQGQAVVGFRFDWAQAPPRGYSVGFSNTTIAQSASIPDAVVVRSEGVEVSNPWTAASAGELSPYQSNTTNVTVNGTVYAGRYATLFIWGNQDTGDNGVGASVAEFAVLANTTAPGTTHQKSGAVARPTVAGAVAGLAVCLCWSLMLFI
ncbi:putative acid trehalase [Coniella lustricola]|uniref:alpha,alpha-trehalase n=1 Tax=Coniella lustricola TaxID=2025994 RepID=A0A2T3A7T7_9PEZI|nr:putative acid trehalase [Coniella lustricola]